MYCIAKLKAALAAVPVSQPCSAAAVEALHAAGHGAARQLVPGPPDCLYQAAHDEQLQEAAAHMQLPRACMPVLAWLAAGLSSGLPPVATQQAHEMTCALIGVMVLVVPMSMEARLLDDESGSQEVQREVLHMLRQLGSTTGETCKRLAQVVTALLAILFPKPAGTAGSSSSSSGGGGGGSGNNSSSNGASWLQQVASQALAWQSISALLTTMMAAAGPEVVVPVLTQTGLFQVLLEGVLPLLAQDPAVHPPAQASQAQVWDCLALAKTAALTLTVELGESVMEAWHTARSQREVWSSGSPTWMEPLARLQVLLLAKMQWDVRQHPEEHGKGKVHSTWRPIKNLPEAVCNMVSPCVAGDLLQQRVPGLVPHTYACKQLIHTPAGVQRPPGVMAVAVEACYPIIGPYNLGRMLKQTWTCLVHCLSVHKTIDAEDLALLLEVTELYCLVCPPGPDSAVFSSCWRLLEVTVTASPYPVQARFAATCGEALLSIAEYLVEDVLLVSQGGAAGGSGAASKPTTAARATAAATSSDGGTGPGIRQTSSSSSSSSSSRRPRAGVGTPQVSLECRGRWAQDAIAALCGLMHWQWMHRSDFPESGSYFDKEGYGTSTVHSVVTSSTAHRVCRLLEVTLRTPELLLWGHERRCGARDLLPLRLPLLHVMASSPAGSQALLCAVLTASKQHHIGHKVMSALVDTGGQLAAAAAGVAAAVPGRMGEWVAQQVLQGPGPLLFQVVQDGLYLAQMASRLMSRAAALIDPVLAPLAAYVAHKWLPAGQDSKPWAVEAALSGRTWLGKDMVNGMFNYQSPLVQDPTHLAGIVKELTAALSLQHAAAAQKQATKLVKAAGGGAAEAEQLRRQLQGMWLRRDGDLPAGLTDAERQQLAARQGPGGFTANCRCGGMSCRCAAAPSGGHQLPCMLHDVCAVGHLKWEEVLAEGDPTKWASALGSTTQADLLVASTGLVVSCKAAGAVAQLPELLQHLVPIMEKQPWGKEMLGWNLYDGRSSGPIGMCCSIAASWALLLAPLLAVLLPAEQAAELQKAAACVQRDTLGMAQLTHATVTRVLGLLQHVMVPGAPGCSYPGCCNLEGRSEADLRVQVCSRCRGARYCCREHQAAHWKAGHKAVCQAAQAAAQKVQHVHMGGEAGP